MHSPMEHLAFAYYASRVDPRRYLEMTYGVRRLATPPPPPSPPETRAMTESLGHTYHECACCAQQLDGQTNRDAFTVPGLGRRWLCDRCVRDSLQALVDDPETRERALQAAQIG